MSNLHIDSDLLPRPNTPKAAPSLRSPSPPRALSPNSRVPLSLDPDEIIVSPLSSAGNQPVSPWMSPLNSQHQHFGTQGFATEPPGGGSSSRLWEREDSTREDRSLTQPVRGHASRFKNEYTPSPLSHQSPTARMMSQVSEAIQDESFLARVKKLDIYGGPKAEFRRQGSLLGFFFSMVALVLGIILMFRELDYSTTIHTVASLEVDGVFSAGGKHISSSFDITFDRINCNHIALSLTDSLGSEQLGVFDEVTIQDLDEYGSPRGPPRSRIVGGAIKPQELQSGLGSAVVSGCGTCMGRGSVGQCCASCDDVKAAFGQSGHTFDPVLVRQCQYQTPPRVDIEPIRGGGCRITGLIELTKAKGNIVFTLSPAGLAAMKPAMNVPLNATAKATAVETWAGEWFNPSHTISKMRFGNQIIGAVPSGVEFPLEGQQRNPVGALQVFQYFLTIVPTNFIRLSGESVTVFQYSVTEHKRRLSGTKTVVVPGLCITYQLSPITARLEEKRLGYLAFLSSACAIIGGLYNVLGMVLHALHAVRSSSVKAQQQHLSAS